MDEWRQAVDRRLAGMQLDAARRMEIVDELSQHLQDRYDELRSGGTPDAEAARAAVAELDDADFLAGRLAAVERAVDPEPAVAGSPGAAPFTAVWRDLRYAIRSLRHSPGFTVIVVVTLALGIGATTAMFSVVNAVMLRPLPFDRAERLVRIYESDVTRGRPEFSVSQPNFLDFRSQNRTFDELAAIETASFTIASGADVESAPGARVTASFLPALGVAPFIGRNFSAEEDRAGANAGVVVLSHGFWQRYFGGDPSVLGRTLTLADRPYSVIGVLPAAFTWRNTDLFVPLAPNPAGQRGDHRLAMIGRLKAGVSIDQASADLKAVAGRLSAQYPDSNGGWSVLLRSFYDWIIPETTRRSLVLFLAAVGFVLLIACSNVANLMLARAASRQKEMSIRVALGASRSRIFSQLLVEALLLALTAGALGCAVAAGVLSVLTAIAPDTLPRIDEVSLDGRVLAFALLVSMATGLLFGLVPAVQASRPDVNDTLKEAGRSGGGGRGRQRLRAGLVVAEVALSVALLVGAGLLMRSLWTLQAVDPGFQTHNLLTMRINMPGTRYPTEARMWAAYQQMLARITALPGIQSAAVSSSLPMSGGNTSIEIVVEGRPAGGDRIQPSADWRVISPGYFRTIGVAVRGREFDDRDDANAPPSAIIGAEMARRYWPGVDPIGRQFFWHSATGPKITVIGVAGDVRNLTLEEDPAPVIYLPISAFRWNPMSFVIRTTTDPAAQASAVRQAIKSVDAGLPITRVLTVDDIIAETLGPRRFTMFLLGAFSALALVLACVGLFGVMSYLVSQRTHEIGVRLALGAVPGDVFRLFVGRGLMLAAAGCAIGIAGAFWLSRSLETLLFNVKPFDPATFAGVCGVLLVVSAAACYWPARRATRVNPVIALRCE